MTLIAYATIAANEDRGITVMDGTHQVAASDAQPRHWGFWDGQFDTEDADDLLDDLNYRRIGDWIESGGQWAAEVEPLPEPEVINLTPHKVTVDGVEFPPSGQIARVEELDPTSAGTVRAGGRKLPVVTVQTGRVVGLPSQREGVYLIVSRMVAEAAPHRRDLLVPHGLVRDEQGRVIGCEGFGQVPDSEPLKWDDPTFGGMSPFGAHERRVSRADTPPAKAQVSAFGCPDHDAACGSTATVTVEFGSVFDARDWAEDAARRAATGTFTRR